MPKGVTIELVEQPASTVGRGRIAWRGSADPGVAMVTPKLPGDQGISRDRRLVMAWS